MSLPNLLAIGAALGAFTLAVIAVLTFRRAPSKPAGMQQQLFDNMKVINDELTEATDRIRSELKAATATIVASRLKAGELRDTIGELEQEILELRKTILALKAEIVSLEATINLEIAAQHALEDAKTAAERPSDE